VGAGFGKDNAYPEMAFSPIAGFSGCLKCPRTGSTLCFSGTLALDSNENFYCWTAQILFERMAGIGKLILRFPFVLIDL
jgi:hypothetical protein